MESDIFKSELRQIDSRNEVFITGLPRSGTTLLLELLHKTGEFSTFTYRHMPFILSPIFWNKASTPFQEKGVSQERAHGDGMQVSFDSPEAFEEVIWLSYLKGKFVRPNLLNELSEKDYTEEFASAIKNTVKKILMLDAGSTKGTKTRRYLSKNNANISRIGLLKEIFPDSLILVPFRDPLVHANSMLKQHKRFLKEHKKDKFSRLYMQWLGHYEFGDNFRPINFDGWLDNKQYPFKVDEELLLQYWIAAYSHLLNAQSDNVYFTDFDALLLNPDAKLEALAECIKLQQKDTLIASANTLRSPTTKHIEASTSSSQATMVTARELHLKMQQLAI